MQFQPEVLVNLNCRTGEGPMWHPDEQRVYWVDIPAGDLFACDPESRQTWQWNLGAAIGGFTLHEDGRLLLFMADGAVRLWSENSLETIVEKLPEEVGNRFNDVIADPEGRVYCGVMSTEERAGRLYRMDPDRHFSVMVEDTGTANGMGFSPDLTHLYFCDSRKKTISTFDYDRSTGALANRQLLLEPPETEGRPDGMTVDSEGCIWSARWDGARLVRLSPNADTLMTIPFPVKNVTSVTFGGGDYTDMYITTAGGDNPEAYGEASGALFHLEANVKGTEEFRSRLV